MWCAIRRLAPIICISVTWPRPHLAGMVIGRRLHWHGPDRAVWRLQARRGKQLHSQYVLEKRRQARRVIAALNNSFAQGFCV